MGLYIFFGNLSIFAFLVYNYAHFHEKKELVGKNSKIIMLFFSKFKCNFLKAFSNSNIWLVLEIFIMAALQYSPVLLNSTFGQLVGTGANYFAVIYFCPLFLLLGCLLLRVHPFKQLDLIAPAYPFALIFVKIACFFGGCCRGIEWSYGVYNRFSGLYEFPVQLLEALVAFLIFIFLEKNKKHFKLGTLLPSYIIIYSLLRFFTEFFRVEPDIWLIFNTYQFLCMFGVVVGILELQLVKILKKKFDINDVIKSYS